MDSLGRFSQENATNCQNDGNSIYPSELKNKSQITFLPKKNKKTNNKNQEKRVIKSKNNTSLFRLAT